GKIAEAEKLGNIFVLDDGFQHRRLFRDFDIVTIDPTEWFAGEKLLPAGRWREPKNAIGRAGAACVQEMPGQPIPTLPVPTFLATTILDGIYRDSYQVPLESVRSRALVAFAGIAKPERFFGALESLGLSLSKRVRFRDHHAYTNRDIET